MKRKEICEKKGTEYHGTDTILFSWFVFFCLFVWRVEIQGSTTKLNVGIEL